MDSIQIDTNILLRGAEPSHQSHQVAVDSVENLLNDNTRVCLTPQNLIEFWNVATRPIENNGFGWTPAQTDSELTKLESALTILPDSQAIYREWRMLVFGKFGSRQTGSRCPNHCRDECSSNRASPYL